jgi:hypothetical protein
LACLRGVVQRIVFLFHRHFAVSRGSWASPIAATVVTVFDRHLSFSRIVATVGTSTKLSDHLWKVVGSIDIKESMMKRKKQWLQLDKNQDQEGSGGEYSLDQRTLDRGSRRWLTVVLGDKHGAFDRPLTI